jgi:hypothetical protein
MAASPAAVTRRPPLVLGLGAMVSGTMAAYSIGSWIYMNLATSFNHFDVRRYYVAAEAGLRYGWSTIYDQAILRALSTSFPAGQSVIDNEIRFASPPLLSFQGPALSVRCQRESSGRSRHTSLRPRSSCR